MSERRGVLIGAARPQKLPALVTEFSIRRRTKANIEILHSWDRPTPEPKNPEFQSRTGFSFVRFTLPERMGFEGVGVYLDSDMLVLDDIERLFDLVVPDAGAVLVCTGNMAAVFAMYCQRFNHVTIDNVFESLETYRVTYKGLMDLKCFDEVRRTVPDCWNSLDSHDAGTKILHYTDMSRQCWRVKYDHPVCKVWKDELRAAVESDFIPRWCVQEEVGLGHVDASLLAVIG